MLNGFKLFKSFFWLSCKEVLGNKKQFLNIFIALIFLANADSLGALLGIPPESNASILLIVVTTLLTFIVVSQIVLNQKKLKGGSDQLKYFVPTFLLNNLYYSFLVSTGFFLFLVPGIFSLILFSLAPFVAVLDDERSSGYFKESKRLVTKNLALVAWASVINLLIELVALGFVPISDPTIKGIGNFLFSIPEAFLTIVMTISFVKIYYSLKEETQSVSPNLHTSESQIP